MNRYWNAKIETKIAKNKLTNEKEKRLFQIKINGINDQNSPFRIKTQRNDELFTQEFNEQFKAILNDANLDESNLNQLDQYLKCAYHGRNKRISLYVVGCEHFNGLLILDENLYSLIPVLPISQTKNQIYRIELISPTTTYNCSTDEEIFQKQIESKIESATKNNTQHSTPHRSIDLTLYIDKRFMHNTLLKNSELFVNYFQNLVLKSQLTWSYYYYEHEIKLKFKQLLIDQYSDLNKYKQQTPNKLFNLDPEDLINKFKLKTLFEQLQQKQQYTPNTINIYTVASNLFTDDLDGLATQFQCNKQSLIVIKDKSESKFQTALEESNILIDLIGSSLGNRHHSNNISNCKHNEYNWYFQVHSIDDPNQQSTELYDNTQVTHCLNRLIKIKDKECPQQISVIKETECGNGIIEANEQCDCGSDSNCFTCCDMKTCKFKTKESECSTGDCCNQTTCKLKPKTQICRYASNNQTESTCDWAEYCNGSSPQCPEDKHHHNGINCSENNEKGICWNANCISTNLQCKQLWSTKAINSDKSCYNNFNTIGFENGNCGQTVNKTIKYKPCEAIHSECGLLQCQQGSNEPSIKSETYFKSTTSVKGQNYECKSITSQPSIYVQDGSTCSQNSVCVQQKCLSLNDIVSVETNKCARIATSKQLCSNNGVCDNKQQCNCFTNWSGKYCDQFTEKSLNLDNNEQFKLKTNSLITLIAGVSIILLIILLLVFLFCRRSRSNRTKQNKCVKKSLSRSLIEFDNDYKIQSDFPNKKQIFSSFKREPATSTRANSIISLNNNSEHTNSYMNNSNNISLTKVNHAIQQLNNQPAKSILKKVSDSLIGVQVALEHNQITEDLNHDSSLKFERQVNRNTILNAAIGNGHRTSRRSLIYDPKRTSVCSLSSSSSISLASSSSESISSSLSKSNKNDKPNMSYSSESISSIVLQEPNKSHEKSDFLKVQDYLNELNILSKQNTFAQLNEQETQVNESPVKPVSLMLTSYQNKLSQSPPRPNSLLTHQSPLSHPTNQMLHLQIGKHNYDETNLFTNCSETSSGYLSNSTTNLNQLVKSTVQVTRLDQLMKSESKESLYETDDYYSIEHKMGTRNHTNKHSSDSNESNSSSRSSSALTPTPPLCTTIYLSPNKKQSVDKRFSYIIATASTNNLDIN